MEGLSPRMWTYLVLTALALSALAAVSGGVGDAVFSGVSGGVTPGPRRGANAADKYAAKAMDTVVSSVLMRLGLRFDGSGAVRKKQLRRRSVILGELLFAMDWRIDVEELLARLPNAKPISRELMLGAYKSYLRDHCAEALGNGLARCDVPAPNEPAEPALLVWFF